MLDEQEQEIARVAICRKCGKPNLLWQPHRKLFRCGWCETDYPKEQAAKLEILSETAYREVMRNRQEIINKCS